MIVGSTIVDVQFAVPADAVLPQQWDSTLGREFRPGIPDRDEDEDLIVWGSDYVVRARPGRLRPGFAMVVDLTAPSGPWRLVVPEIRISQSDQLYTMKWMLSPSVMAEFEAIWARRIRT